MENLESFIGNTPHDEETLKNFINDLEKSFDEIETGFFDSYSKVDFGYKKTNEFANDPFYNYETDSGFDLQSMEEFSLPSLGRRAVPTGLSFNIPEGYEIQVRPRSGSAINIGLSVLNTPGTVDSGWTDEVKVILINLSDTVMEIKKGMKIAQAVLSPVVNGRKVNFKKLDEIPSKDRNKNGFGY